MKRLFSILCVSALVSAFAVACNENAEPVLPQSTQQTVVVNQPETVVSETQAVDVAGAFFALQSGEGGATRAATLAQTTPASVKAVRADACTPAMHVINYPGGGFAIISATRDYYPVLAYSDEGSFELTDDMGPVDVWLSETKESIRVASSLDAEAKASIRAEWNRLEPVDAEIAIDSSALITPQRAYHPQMQQAFYNRLSQLNNQYYSQGYTVMSLSQASNYLSGSNDLQQINDLAAYYGSPPEYTLVAVQQQTITNTIGPFTTTTWDQPYPYNYYCLDEYGDYVDAGCAAVATAQLMKAYGRPTYINWGDMPDVYYSYMLQNNTVLPAFIKEVGDRLGLDYDNSGNTGASDFYVDLRNTLNYYGYKNVTISDPNTTTVVNWITNERKPMMMVGYNRDETTNKSSGHQWLCDGVKTSIFRTHFFVEFISPGYYTYSHNWHWPDTSPGEFSSSYTPYFRINWGWSGWHDGWYISSNHTAPPRSDGHNYQYLRKNIYAKP